MRDESTNARPPLLQAFCTLLLCSAAALFSPPAAAAPADCIGQSPDGQAICLPPELSPVGYNAGCVPSSAISVVNAERACHTEWGLANGPVPSEGPVIGDLNCIYQRVTGSSASPVGPFAWKGAGETVTSSFCWSGTVTWRYGVEMLGFAEQSVPGWYTVGGRRERSAYCRPGEQRVFTSDGQDHCSLPVVNSSACGVGNPADPGLGVKIERSIDYAGAGAHPLSFERIYRSAWYPQVPESRVGGQWAHNYSASLHPLEASTHGTRYVLANRADGQHHVHRNSGSGWLPATATRDTLSELRDAAGALSGWQLKLWADDSTETYDATGKLLSIKARNGWTTTLTYSDAATPPSIAPRAGLLIGVRNHFGRELKFSYDALGRMVELLPPGAVSGLGAGSAASPIRYAYDEAAGLGPGVAAQGQLTSITWQDGAVRRYHYEQAELWYMANEPQLLTGITDEAGVRFATFTYGTTGYVTAGPPLLVRSEHAGGADRVDFSYSVYAGLPRTRVTEYSSGSARESLYTFEDSANTRRPIAVSAPCPLCGNTQQSSSYNAAGDPIKQIAHDGSVTFFAYDAKARETERATYPSSYATATTRPALSNAAKVVSTQWHATFNLPTKLAEPNKTTAWTYNAKGMVTGESWTATTDATGADQFNAVKTGSTYATGWGYSASSLVTSIVTRETPAGATTATETGRWTLGYNVAGDVSRVTDAGVTPNAIASINAFSAGGQPSTGRLPDGRMFSYGYGADSKVSSLQLSDGYRVDYSYNARRQLTEARATDGGLLQITIGSDGTPNKYTANGEIVFDRTVSAARAASASSFLDAAGVTSEALPRPIPLPEINWGSIGSGAGAALGRCIGPLATGLSLLLFSSEVGTCSTVDGRANKKECKKDPCENELPTSTAARREAMRRVGLPVESSVAVASNLSAPGFEQYVYWVPSQGAFVVLSHHPADGDHPCPHWHAGAAKMTRSGSSQVADIDTFSNGAWRYSSRNVVVAHRNE